jgi:hypothetical protein
MLRLYHGKPLAGGLRQLDGGRPLTPPLYQSITHCSAWRETLRRMPTIAPVASMEVPP